MPNVAIKLPPGMYRNGTKEQAQGRWYDGSLVRFRERTIRPWGGWRPLLRLDLYLDPDYLATADDYVESPQEPIVGSVRTALAWRDNDGTAHLAFGTNSNLYAYVGGDIYDITPAGINAGGEDTESATGAYGAGAYGAGPYGQGDPASQGLTEAGVWRLDTFGEQLLGVLSPSDGNLYVWDTSLVGVATVVANAPTSLRGVVVSEERHVIALGSDGNPRRIDWASQETLTTWDDLATNTAGGFELATPGRLMCGRRVRGGVLLLTDVDSHLMEYVGPPFIYGKRRLGSGGVIGPNAVAVLDSGAVWMGRRNFMLYDGNVREIPCEVADYVFGDFNARQGVKVSAHHNADLSEVTWHYPSRLSQENDRYVTLNYAENHWTTGMLARAAGVGRGAFEQPLLLSVTGAIYEHEVGFDYGSLAPYIESGPFSIGGADNVMMCRKLIPDEKTLGDCTATFYGADHPTNAEASFGPYSLADETDIRLTARRVRVRFDGAVAADWRIGHPLVEAVVAGRR